MKTAGSLASATLVAVLSAAAARPGRADVVTDWNARAADIATGAKLPAPMTYRTMAIVQVAVREALASLPGEAPPRAAIDGAAAAATRATLTKLVPVQQEAIEAAWRQAMNGIPESPARAAGIAAGEKAAAEVLVARDGDGSAATEPYRPHTSPGAYVPTALPIVPHWGKRRPWFLSAGDQLRPPPPPELSSAVWARDQEEVRTLGGKSSTRRTPEQTAIARFWEATTPAVYFPLARALTDAPGRSPIENARLLATMAMAMDDALLAVFDAKYAYGFWRPVTAIRNGDRDGNDATERDAGWLPLLDTPMHPEYPCAHCIVAATAGAVLQAAAGTGSLRISTTSPTAPGVVRSWDRIDDMVAEVALARICGGMHYRNSTEVGAAMGRKLGAMAASARKPAEAR